MESRPKFREKTLLCVDCEEEFQFTAGEQAYYWSKGLTEPRRCRPCRQRRKLTIMPAREVPRG